jgi:hypothetical protein
MLIPARGEKTYFEFLEVRLFKLHCIFCTHYWFSSFFFNLFTRIASNGAALLGDYALNLQAVFLVKSR